MAKSTATPSRTGMYQGLEPGDSRKSTDPRSEHLGGPHLPGDGCPEVGLGLASGIMTTAHELGAALGIAVLAAVATSKVEPGERLWERVLRRGGDRRSARLRGSDVLPALRPAPFARVDTSRRGPAGRHRLRRGHAAVRGRLGVPG